MLRMMAASMDLEINTVSLGGMVVHTCNSYFGGEDWRIAIHGQSPNKGTKPYLKNKLKQKGIDA
jgi:hypothetical protein